MTDGIPSSNDVDYNVRNAGDSFATDYVSVGYWDMWESVWVDMEYYPGMGVVGRYYALASKYDGSTPENVTTRGYWTP